MKREHHPAGNVSHTSLGEHMIVTRGKDILSGSILMKGRIDRRVFRAVAAIVWAGEIPAQQVRSIVVGGGK